MTQTTKPKKALDRTKSNKVDSDQALEVDIPQRLRVDLVILKRQLNGTLQYVDRLIAKNS